ncbi:hypothetical protein D3C87_2139370 [compost metagenome]
MGQIRKAHPLLVHQRLNDGKDLKDRRNILGFRLGIGHIKMFCFFWNYILEF